MLETNNEEQYSELRNALSYSIEQKNNIIKENEELKRKLIKLEEINNQLKLENAKLEDGTAITRLKRENKTLINLLYAVNIRDNNPSVGRVLKTMGSWFGINSLPTPPIQKSAKEMGLPEILFSTK